MITYKDIHIAVNRQLKKTGIEINSRDVEEGFIRPSFFVQLGNINRSGDSDQVHKSLIVQIYYFPTDRYEYAIEVLEIQETLQTLFDLKLPVKDRYFNVNELYFNMTDGILNCSFDLEFEHGRKFIWNKEGIEHPFEPMEELDFEKVEE